MPLVDPLQRNDHAEDNGSVARDFSNAMSGTDRQQNEQGMHAGLENTTGFSPTYVPEQRIPEAEQQHVPRFPALAKGSTGTTTPENKVTQVVAHGPHCTRMCDTAPLLQNAR